MTDEIVVRDARFDESRYIMEMTRLMVREMERYGGRAPTTDESAWDKHAVRIAEELKEAKFKYLIAEVADGKRIGLAGARINILEGVFAAKRTIEALVTKYLTPTSPGDKRIPGILTESCFNKRADSRPQDAASKCEFIVSDYYLLECLLVLTAKLGPTEV